MAERGVIRHREWAQQIKDFSGLRFGSITPTDIDGMIEYHGNCFIFTEIKYGGFDMSRGQKLAYTRLIDALNKPAVLFVAGHLCPPEEDIPVADLIVGKYYWLGKWYEAEFTVVEGHRQFIKKFGANHG